MKNIPLFKVFIPDETNIKLKETLRSGYIAEGVKTKEFTKLISKYIGNPKTLLTNSCTTSLLIAYRIAGVGRDTEVITTPLTSIATNVPILSLGAKPIWADVDRKTGLSSYKDVESLITPKTKAILLLHKDGNIADLNKFKNLADKHGIYLIEDAAHAFGGSYKNKKIGNHGNLVCFSFQAVKHLTTGDGGALSCRNKEDYDKAKKLKWFGVDHDNIVTNPWEKDITEIGYKGNMNDISSTIGIEQMKYFDNILQIYINNGKLYSKLLKNILNIKTIPINPSVVCINWVYTILSENRDTLIKELRNNGIGCGQVHPRNDVWSIFKESKRNLPNVDYFANRELSLPCGWWVTKEDIEKICNIVRSIA